MLKFIAEPDLQIAGYYQGRWNYMASAIGMVQDLAGDAEAAQVLELGPYLLPLVKGCHTMDIRPEANPTFLHDARRQPWPIKHGTYRVFIALQVLEHLGPPEGDAQVDAFAEIRRVCRGPVVISVPYRWPASQGWHAGIDEAVIERWAGRAPDRCFVDSSTFPRIVCAWISV